MVKRKLTFRDKSGKVIKTGTRDVSVSKKITTTSKSSGSSSSSGSGSSSRAPVQIEASLSQDGVETIKTTQNGKTTISVSKPKGSSSSSRVSTSPGALQARIIDAKSGKVIQQGQFKLDRAYEERRRQAEKNARIELQKQQERVSNLARQGIATGTITPPKQTTIYSGLTLSEKARLAESRINSRRSDDLSAASVGDAAILASAGLASGALSLVEVILNPIDSAVALGKAIFSPKNTINAIQADIRKSPVTFTLETIGAAGAGEVISKPISSIVKQVKKVKLFAADEVANIDKELARLSKADQTREVKSNIKALETNKKIIQDNLKSVTTATNNLEQTFKPIIRDIKNNPSKSKAKKLDTQVKTNIKKIKSIRQDIKNINQATQKTKKIRTKALKPETISKKLGEFFKQDTKGNLKLKKTLPNDLNELNKLVNRAFTESGEAFSKLKKQIKKELGLNVVGTKKKGKMVFRILEPKDLKIKAPTGKKSKPKIINLELKKAKIIETKVKQTKKQLKDIEFQEGQNLDKVLNDVRNYAKQKEFFDNKKAQARLSLDFKKSFNKASKRIKADITISNNNIKKYSNTYKNKFQKKLKDIKNSKDKTKLKAQAKTLQSKIKTERVKLNKLKSELNLLNNIRDLMKLAGILSVSLNSAASASVSASLQDQGSLQDQAQKLIQKLEFKTPKSPTKPTPKPTPKSPTKPTPKPKTIKTIKPIKKIKLPNIKIDFDSKRLDNKVLTFKGSFRERKYRSKPASKKNPIIVKKINIKDTKNRALIRVADRVDNSLARSLTLEVTGIGRAKKDIKKPKNLNKFKLKKSENTPVLKLVEQSKSLFDTKGEKREAKKQRSLKPKSKKKIKKKVKVSAKKKKSR